MTNSDNSSPEQARREAEHQSSVAKSSRRRQLRRTNKRMRRNLKPRGPRPGDWTDYDAAARDGHEEPSVVRIMPRDELDRRRSVERAAFGAVDAPEADRRGLGAKTGLVVAVSRGSCEVEADGYALNCSIRGALTGAETQFTNAVAVGDQVVFDEDDAGAGTVLEVLPRTTVLTRPDVFYSHRQQVIVANADQLLVVSSWREPPIWPELIDRCIIAAALAGLKAVICINKLDLVEDRAVFDDTVQLYRELGHRVVATSAKTGKGVDELRAILQRKVTVLAGLSGTGKSSLLASVQPGLDLRVGAVSARSGQGRHTTTQGRLLHLKGGGRRRRYAGHTKVRSRRTAPARARRTFPGYRSLRPKLPVR